MARLFVDFRSNNLLIYRNILLLFFIWFAFIYWLLGFSENKINYKVGDCLDYKYNESEVIGSRRTVHVVGDNSYLLKNFLGLPEAISAKDINSFYKKVECREDE